MKPTLWRLSDVVKKLTRKYPTSKLVMASTRVLMRDALHVFVRLILLRDRSSNQEGLWDGVLRLRTKV